MTMEQHEDRFRFELMLSTEELDGLREKFKATSPTSIGNRLLATIDQRNRALARTLVRIAALEETIEALRVGP